MKAIPVVAIVLGLLMLVASALWGHLFPPTRSWTDEKSERLAELGSETNRLKFALVEAQNSPSMHAGKNPGEIKLEYDAARAEYDELHAEFESARDSPETVSGVLRWTSIVLIGVGTLWFYASGNQS
ncbi:MAG: hypothetical protein KDA57_03855 [Planctomycetales bacterium]|nr:hypothetical protein [Planctomycetales bacterium]